MARLQKTIIWMTIFTETTHIFCCVLPALFSVLSLLAGLGAIGILPVWFTSFHDVLHAWELPLIIMSLTVLLVGWGLYGLSRRIDCHDTGCAHGDCAPKKDMALLILKIASALFFINIVIYFGIHRHWAPQTHQYGEAHNHTQAGDLQSSHVH